MSKVFGEIENAHKAVKAMKLRQYHESRLEKLPYDLRIDDFYIPSHCPVLGLPLVFKGGDNAPTFHRINKARGYVRGNFVIISRRASVIMNNVLKPDAMSCARYMDKLAVNIPE